MGNADETKERLLKAATVEFAAYGIAGARVDRIAKNAECSKNLIYMYFESKEKLFTTVLQRHLMRVYEDIVFTPNDLPDYAGRAFDFMMVHPELMRLMAWFALEQKADNPLARAKVHIEKVTALTKAQREGHVGTKLSPGFLLTVIMTIATAWAGTNPFGLLDSESVRDQSALRNEIVRVVRLIVQDDMM